MECPVCRFENREGRRYCAECGAALSSACPDCGFVNDPSEKFCGGCGIALTSQSTPSAPGSAAEILSTALHPVDAQPEHTEPERRQVTVLFCDLVGSTALSERLDPEELSELLAAYQDTCAKQVNTYGGYIARYVGDALLVYFGYPQAHEDDPQRAVRAGLDILTAMDEFNANLVNSAHRLAVRIGINTGTVVAGDIGVGERREKMALVGETPNVAARLQTLAEPGTVVIGASTHRLIEGQFICEGLGLRRLKGISEPVAAFQVLEQSEAHGRFGAMAKRGLTPLIGREEEVNLLLKRWEQAKEGEGQLVVLSAEAGAGKSRLLKSFQERVENDGFSRALYFCSPYHRDTPLYSVIDQLPRGLRFAKDDTIEQKLDKLDAVLVDLGLAVAECAPVLASLLSLPSGDRYPRIDLSLKDKRAKTTEALVAIVEAMTLKSPVLMIIEDCHWIDPSTLEFLEVLVDRLKARRFLLVSAFRADFEPRWLTREDTTVITLKRLSRAESMALILQATGGKRLPEEVLEHILDRTDGVPLFVEELTKTVLESELLMDMGASFELSAPLPPHAIPASLQDSLMARLDRLAPVKEVAQLAAALGRHFSFELLSAVSRIAETVLQDSLVKLVESGLIYRRGLPPDVMYEFKHALVQDAAYASLLRNKRQQLHKEIAAKLEERFPDMVQLKPELLAHHFRAAGMPEQAVSYALRAGDAAAERYASPEATVHYENALKTAKSLPPSDSAFQWQIQSIISLVKVAASRKHFQRDLENLDYARTLAEKLDDQDRLRQILYWTGRTHYVLGRFDLGVQYAEQSLQLAEALGGADKLTADAVNLLARTHCLLGEPKAASAYAARNVTQMRNLNNQIEEAAIGGVLAFACGLHGQFSSAFEAAQQAVDRAQHLQHAPTLAACFMFRAVVEGWYGDVDAAQRDFDTALDFSEKSSDVFRQYLSYGWRGEANLLAERFDAAKVDLTRCLQLGERLGTSFHRGAFLAFLAKLHLIEGDLDNARRLSEEALEEASDVAQAWSRSIALRACAEVLMALTPADLCKADDAVQAAIEIQQRHECRPDLARSQLVAGRVLLAKGDAQRARSAFAEAQRLFSEMELASGRSQSEAALVALT